MGPTYSEAPIRITFIIENSFIASFIIFVVVVAASNVIGLVLSLKAVSCLVGGCERRRRL